MKPHLPPEVEDLFPVAIVKHIETFVPHTPKPKKTPPVTPEMERDLRRIQAKLLKGKSQMYMRDLEDFILD